jgi:hypothetical protein
MLEGPKLDELHALADELASAAEQDVRERGAPDA